MKEKTLQYKSGNRIVSIVVEDMGNGIMSFPSFKPIPSVPQNTFFYSGSLNSPQKPSLSTSCGEQELNGDLLRLIPDNLEGNVFDKIQIKFGDLLKWHMQQYGRLLDDDLSAYINEMILVIRGVHKEMNNPSFPYLSNSEAQEVYNSIFKAVKQAQSH